MQGIFLKFGTHSSAKTLNSDVSPNSLGLAIDVFVEEGESSCP